MNGKLLVLSMVAVVLAAGVAIGADATDEEGEEIAEVQRRQIAVAVGSADLVAVVKVTEVAEPKKEDAEKKDEADGANRKNVGMAAFGMGGRQMGTEKVYTAEIAERLKGEEDAKIVKIKARILLNGKQEVIVISVDREIKTPDGAVMRKFSQQMHLPFTLEKDKSSLVFLKLAGEGKGEQDKAAERFYNPIPPILDGAPEKALVVVREALKQIEEWKSPPKLAAEEQAAVEKLVAQLGDNDFATREEATKALIAKGAAIKALVEAAVKSEDPEVSQRATQVLEAIKPECLKPQDPFGSSPTGGGGVIMMRNGGVQMQLQQVVE